MTVGLGSIEITTGVMLVSGESAYLVELVPGIGDALWASTSPSGVATTVVVVVVVVLVKLLLALYIKKKLFNYMLSRLQVIC